MRLATDRQCPVTLFAIFNRMLSANTFNVLLFEGWIQHWVAGYKAVKNLNKTALFFGSM